MTSSRDDELSVLAAKKKPSEIILEAAQKKVDAAPPMEERFGVLHLGNGPFILSAILDYLDSNFPPSK